MKQFFAFLLITSVFTACQKDKSDMPTTGATTFTFKANGKLYVANGASIQKKNSNGIYYYALNAGELDGGASVYFLIPTSTIKVQAYNTATSSTGQDFSEFSTLKAVENRAKGGFVLTNITKVENRFASGTLSAQMSDRNTGAVIMITEGKFENVPIAE